MITTFPSWDSPDLQDKLALTQAQLIEKPISNNNLLPYLLCNVVKKSLYLFGNDHI